MGPETIDVTDKESIKYLVTLDDKTKEILDSQEQTIHGRKFKVNTSLIEAWINRWVYNRYKDKSDEELKEFLKKRPVVLRMINNSLTLTTYQNKIIQQANGLVFLSLVEDKSKELESETTEK